MSASGSTQCARAQLWNGSAWIDAPGDATNGLKVQVQGTVPVSLAAAPTTAVTGPLTDAQLRATAVPVSGTFYQATQPVSLASAPTTAVTGPLTDTQLRATAVPVSGTVTASGPLTDTQLRATAVPVSGPLTDTQIRASALPVSGTVTISNPTTNPETGLAKDATLTGGTTKAINRGGVKGATTAADVTSTAEGADHQAMDVQIYHGGATKDPTQIRALTSADVVSGPTLTKGTQGASGYSVQSLMDAGRAQVMLNWHEMAGTAAAESSLTNFTAGSLAAVALSAATNYAVSAGKTLLIQEIRYYVKASSTVNNICQFRLRQAGTVANSSPIIWAASLALPLGTTAAGAWQEICCVIPGGLQVAAAQQIAFTWFTAANTCTVGLALTGYEF